MPPRSIMNSRSQPDAVEVELIRSLFYAFIPAAIMSVGFALCGALIVWKTRDPLLLSLLVSGLVVSATRLAVTHFAGSSIKRKDLTIQEARRIEGRFALPYVGFAALLGMFGQRTMALPFPAIHMLLMCMLVGYCAGVAAGIALRPKIAIPSMMVSIVPAALTALAKPDATYWAMSLFVLALLAGGIHSMRRRHHRAIRNTGLRMTFAALARKDGLTALPNRLALREWFDDNVSYAHADGAVAVHYLDLNGFKPINDTYGHPAGDALLTAAARRIAHTIRDSDMAARLGGDEFAIIQRDIAHPQEAELLARRLCAAIARPFKIDEHDLSISASIGYVVSNDRAHDLEHLLSLADKGLYASKRGDRGITGFSLDDDQRAAA